MGRSAATKAGQITFEEERMDAVEGALRGSRERPADRITQTACAFLLRHLMIELPEQQRTTTAAW